MTDNFSHKTHTKNLPKGGGRFFALMSGLHKKERR